MYYNNKEKFVYLKKMFHFYGHKINKLFNSDSKITAYRKNSTL